MGNFAMLYVSPFMGRIAKKKLFGGVVFPIGQFLVIQTWVYQLGGLTAFEFSECPSLLGKLLGATSEYESMATNLEELALQTSNVLDKSNKPHPSFFDLYLFQQLANLEIDINTSRGQRMLNQTIKDPAASDMVKLVFVQGASLGWNFPIRFKEVFEATYDNDEIVAGYAELAQLGLAETNPRRISLTEAAIELHGAVIDWAGNQSGVTLTSEELSYVNPPELFE